MVLKKISNFFNPSKRKKQVAETLAKELRERVKTIEEALKEAQKHPKKSGADIGPVVLTPTEEGKYKYERIDEEERTGRIKRIIDGARSEILYGNPFGREIEGSQVDKQELLIRYFPGSAVLPETGIIVWMYASDMIDGDTALQLLNRYEKNPEHNEAARAVWSILGAKKGMIDRMEEIERLQNSLRNSKGKGGLGEQFLEIKRDSLREYEGYPLRIAEVTEVARNYADGRINRDAALMELDKLYEIVLRQYKQSVGLE